ncbi:hypothetical protein ABQW55_019700 [Xanthomonas citri pv. malvacearum]|uniref:hypothetical protein n=1 Tax=Xanthomonas TaxID=338 RepID=UPI000AD2511F|nr:MULTISPECIES: hypothetical protein [Xanthomonas]QGL16720.1 hypothetical protein GH913_07820 [Xanthomonas citri pv. malvacearum]WAW86588.1 hypothetical protein LPY96_20610 [Xanthomonas citri pv. malvacearum]WAW90726.1 hypothetical protein LPY95_19170 [Xanthomonas citri pv. malvacearum]WAW94894.1 hypothetical protein LGM68_19615 [Xanthomonas citri pv. malvacearum]
MSRACSLAAKQVVPAKRQCRGVLLAAATAADLPAVATSGARCPSVNLRVQVSRRHIARNMEHDRLRARHSCERSQATA